MSKFHLTTTTLAVAMGLAATACGEPATTSSRQLSDADRAFISANHLTQLTNAELNALLRGVVVREETGLLGYEGFECNGSWTASGALVPIGGTYEIRDGQVCIQEGIRGRARDCHKMFRGESGRLFVQPPRDMVQGFAEFKVERRGACP